MRDIFYSHTQSEDMYDVICSELGFEEDTKELREMIALFGNARYEQGFQKGQICVK